MPANLQKHFIPALYVVLGLLLAANIMSLLSGNLLALVSLAVQFTVLGVVYFGKPWAYIAVKLWAFIVMLAGLAMWLAVLLDGTKYFHSVFNAVFNTLMLFAGFYFFNFAKPALQQVRERI
ncbi:hypothetical protein [Dyella sp. S184]|uniref:hypothetical protein n=1 Tax=Dyella sp. S184 TaxID=1641862 RepID=UPI00131E9388|nr:hypothetical protein [Dyella sp. S184]